MLLSFKINNSYSFLSKKADAGILVIDARINAFESGFERDGQTRWTLFLNNKNYLYKILIKILNFLYIE